MRVITVLAQLLPLLACRPQAVAPTSADDARLLPVLEAVVRLRADDHPHLVLDSLALRRDLGISSSDVAHLARRLEGVARIGIATQAGTCAERPYTDCTILGISSVTFHEDTARLTATWGGTSPCGSHSTWVLAVRRAGTPAMSVETVERIVGHCYPDESARPGRPAPGSISLVAAIEALALHHGRPDEHLVLDVAMLEWSTRLTVAEEAELRQRLQGRVTVGRATGNGGCLSGLKVDCTAMYVRKYESLGDSVRVNVLWVPLDRCSDSFTDAYTLRRDGRDSITVSLLDRAVRRCRPGRN